MSGKISICAVIVARNEAPYLQYLLPYLAEQNIDVVIIDNESTDSSNKIYAAYANKPVIEVLTLPFTGVFSLPAAIAKKFEVYNKLSHDWLIHHDADEIMQHRESGRSLRNAIEEADATGYNALNFEEFVFVPNPGEDFTGEDYYKKITRYYFFEPSKNRLNRAWKRQLQVTTTGGHRLLGSDIRVSVNSHILRHYIALGEEHSRNKYLHRKFAQESIARGMHKNRLNFTESNLRMPGESPFIFKLDSVDSKDFCRKKSTTKHFWEW
jgi:glycosyltransferase involved in cell wall biosynthesis